MSNINKYLFLFLALGFLACKDAANQEKTVRPNTVPSNIDPVLVAISAQLEQDPTNPKLRYERAQMLYKSNLLDEATEDLRVAMLQDSLVPEYYHLLADVFLDNAVSSKALQTMQVAANIFPKRIPTLLKLSEIQLILQFYDESIMTLNEILRQDPQNGEAYFMLGLNFKEMGDEKRAVNALKTATEFDAKIVDAWIILGNIFDEKKSPDAERYFNAAVNIAPDNVNALHAKAYFLQNHDNIPEALDLYSKIIMIDGDYLDAYVNAGILYLDANELEKALEQFNILAGKSPQDWRAYYYRSLVYKLMGNKNSALADIKSAINLNPKFEMAEQVKVEIENM